mgnify:CR=1 FL=1
MKLYNILVLLAASSPLATHAESSVDDNNLNLNLAVQQQEDDVVVTTSNNNNLLRGTVNSVLATNYNVVNEATTASDDNGNGNGSGSTHHNGHDRGTICLPSHAVCTYGRNCCTGDCCYSYERKRFTCGDPHHSIICMPRDLSTTEE